MKVARSLIAWIQEKAQDRKDRQEKLRLLRRWQKDRSCPKCGCDDQWGEGPEGGAAIMVFCDGCCTEFVMVGNHIERSSNDFSSDAWYSSFPGARSRLKALAELG